MVGYLPRIDAGNPCSRGGLDELVVYEKTCRKCDFHAIGRSEIDLDGGHAGLWEDFSADNVRVGSGEQVVVNVPGPERETAVACYITRPQGQGLLSTKLTLLCSRYPGDDDDILRGCGDAGRGR